MGGAGGEVKSVRSARASPLAHDSGHGELDAARRERGGRDGELGLCRLPEAPELGCKVGGDGGVAEMRGRPALDRPCAEDSASSPVRPPLPPPRQIQQNTHRIFIDLS